MSATAPSEWWRPDLVADLPEPGGRSGAPGRIGSSPHSFRGLLLFTFILVISPQNFIPALAPMRIALVAAGGAILACLWQRLSEGEPLSVGAREIRLTGLLAAWAVLTLPLSYWPGGSASFLLDVYFKSVAIFWLLCNTVDTEARLRTVLWALSLMSIPLAATAVLNFQAGAFVPGVARGDLGRIVGYTAPLTTNPNDLALMLNLILPLTGSLLLAGGSPHSRALLASTIALSILAVLLTFSRGGFLTLATITLCFLFRRLRGRGAIWALAAVAAGVLCLPLLPAVYLDHLRTITDIAADKTGSAQERWSDMLSAAEFVSRHPIVGAGAGMNTLALDEVRGTRWRMVHNVYLEYAADLGLPGLALFVILLLESIASAGWARRRSSGHRGGGPISAYAEGIQISLAGFAVAAMFHPVSYHFYFYYIAALAVSARRIAASSPERVEEA